MKGTIIDYGNANRTIFKGSVRVFSITLAGDGAAADLQVYDGDNSNEPQKCHLEAASGDTVQALFRGGAVMNRGIYIAVNASTSKFTIEYLPVFDCE